MAAVEISPQDLEAHPDIKGDVDPVKALGLISTVVARAARFAPCILLDGFDATEAAKGVLLDVIARRYNSVLAGGSYSRAEGPYSESYDTRNQPAVTFWPAEVAELQAMCRATSLDQGIPLGSFPDPEPWPDPSVVRRTAYYYTL